MDPLRKVGPTKQFPFSLVYQRLTVVFNAQPMTESVAGVELPCHVLSCRRQLVKALVHVVAGAGFRPVLSKLGP